MSKFLKDLAVIVALALVVKAIEKAETRNLDREYRELCNAQ